MNRLGLRIVVLVLLAALLPVAAFADNGEASGADADSPRHEEFVFEYGEPAEDEPYLIQFPKESRASHPLLVFLHGAGGSHRRQWLDDDLIALRQEAYERGYYVLSPHLGERHWMNERADKVLEQLLDKVIEEYPIDTDRVHVMGISLGGGAALTFTAHRPERIASVCDVFGFTDFRERYGARDLTSSFAAAFGGDPAEHPEIHQRQSAMAQLDAFSETPVLVIHGDADEVVSVEHSRRFVEALRERDYPVRYIEKPGIGHAHEVYHGDEGLIFDFLDGKLVTGG